MAGSTNAHIKNLRETQGQKEGQFLRGGQTETELSTGKNRKFTTQDVMLETIRYEKYSKYWSIVSNIAALVSLTSVVYGLVTKKRSWF